MSDWLGKLYNKDAVLRFLLPAAAAASAAATDSRAATTTSGSSGSSSKADNEAFLAGRIRSLKDIVEVKFEVEQDADNTGSTDHRAGATAAVAATKGSAGARRRKERWVCPVTRKELGPSVRSVYLSPCGHAFSEIAIREVAEGSCLQVIFPILRPPFSSFHPSLLEIAVPACRLLYYDRLWTATTVGDEK